MSKKRAQILECAKLHGMAIKLHTEQFQRIGGLEYRGADGALSVDHLEACAPEQIALLASSSTIATILPGVTLHLGIRAAPGQATYRGGCCSCCWDRSQSRSSPLFSTAAALALVVRLNGLTAERRWWLAR